VVHEVAVAVVIVVGVDVATRMIHHKLHQSISFLHSCTNLSSHLTICLDPHQSSPVIVMHHHSSFELTLQRVLSVSVQLFINLIIAAGSRMCCFNIIMMSGTSVITSAGGIFLRRSSCLSFRFWRLFLTTPSYTVTE
jgi:hypothetical protein